MKNIGYTVSKFLGFFIFKSLMLDYMFVGSKTRYTNNLHKSIHLNVTYGHKKIYFRLWDGCKQQVYNEMDDVQ